MIIERVELKNFASFEDAELQLEGAGLVLLTGRNGSGKSNLFRGIVWGLYGKGPEGERGGGIVRRGCAIAEVTISLRDDGGNRYRVVRRQRKDRREQEVIDESTPDAPLHHDADGVDAWVEQALGLDHAAFCSCCIYSTASARFADPSTSDAARKDIIRGLIGTVDFTGAAARARARDALLKSKIGEIEAKRRADREAAARESTRATELEAGFARWKAGVAATAAKHRAAAKAYRDAAAVEGRSVAEISADFVAAAAVVASFDVEALKIERAEARKKDDAARAEVGAVNARVRTADAALKQAKAHKAEGKCVTCWSDLATAPKTTATTDSLPALKRAHDDAVADVSDRAARAAETAAALEAVDEKMRTRDEARDAHAALAAELRVAEDRALAIVNADAADEAARVAEAETSELQTQSAKATEEAKKLAARDERYAVMLEKLATTKALASFWVRAFGPEGIPAFLVDEALPEVQERANVYLSVLSGAELRISFDVSSKTKAGDRRDKIGVSWTIDGVPDVPLSTGQKRKVDIAVTIALITLARSRRLEVPSIFLVDEAMDGLDEPSRALVVNLLRKLRKEFSAIIVVSHDTSAPGLFDHAMTVVREPAGTSMLVGA